MKNVSWALLVLLAGSSIACAGAKDPSASGSSTSSPPPTVTVPPVQTAEPVADKPKEDKPVEPEVTPPPEERPAGRLALIQCTDESRKVAGCTKENRPVCAEVDTGIRCIRAPCPSMAQQTYANACSACVNKNVRGYWAMSCEDMTKPTAP
jgi:hypothetical protein